MHEIAPAVFLYCKCSLFLFFWSISGEHWPLLHFTAHPTSMWRIKFLNPLFCEITEPLCQTGFDSVFRHSLSFFSSSVVTVLSFVDTINIVIWNATKTGWRLAACVNFYQTHTRTRKKGNLATACFDVKSIKYCRGVRYIVNTTSELFTFAFFKIWDEILFEVLKVPHHPQCQRIFIF